MVNTTAINGLSSLYFNFAFTVQSALKRPKMLIIGLIALAVLTRAWGLRENSSLSSLDETTKRIKQIKGKWSDSVDKEIERYQKEKPKLIERVNRNFPGERKTVLVSFLRALEIMEELKQSHCCFLHGQSQESYELSHFIKAYITKKNPSLKRKYQQFFRFPNQVTKYQNVSSFLLSNQEVEDLYKNRNDLISVSGMPLAKEYWCSAHYFFKANKNAYGPVVKKSLESVLSQEAAQMAFDGLETIQKDTAKKAKFGVLHLICVPNKLVDDESVRAVYHSEVGGRPASLGTIGLLRSHQNLYHSPGESESTQYRILTSSLKEENEILTIPICCELNKEERRERRQRIASLVN